MNAALPRWAELGLLPVLNIVLALLVSALVLLAAGQDPVAALHVMISGALGSGEAVAYTLYYATDMVFTGLAVAVAFHCGLFNIGVEGQAYVAGLGAALVCLFLDRLPGLVVVPLAIVAAAGFGAFWAAIPGWLQAKRGSHIVITTIMFNFMSYALMVYLIVNWLIAPGQGAPETRTFAPHTWMPRLGDWLAPFVIAAPGSPLNAATLIAIAALFAVWLLIFRSGLGYAIRVVGASPRAAVYAGIDPGRHVIIAMLISGGLAGGVALNEVVGGSHKLLIGFTAGYGFTGIAVALIGRNHPVGVLLAALLFGALYQGGAELAFDMPAISPDLVVVLQGLVILFTGALGAMLRPALVRVLGRRAPQVAA